MGRPRTSQSPRQQTALPLQVAGLVAPRHLLTVNGDQDALHPVHEVGVAAASLKRIFTAAGAGERYQHRYGSGGHRFYAELMWPWIEEAL